MKNKDELDIVIRDHLMAYLDTMVPDEVSHPDKVLVTLGKVKEAIRYWWANYEIK